MPAIAIRVDSRALAKVVSAIPGVGGDIAFAGAEFAEGVAKELAPVDTGFLRSQIQAVRKGSSAWLESNAPYGVYQEFGVPSRNMDAQPHLRPAIRAVPWIRIVREQFRARGL